MKWLLLIALAFPTKVLGLEIEIGVGQASYSLTDGIWWQSPYGFNGNVRPASIEFGIRERKGDFGFHAAYVDLGHVTGNNLFSMRDEDFGRMDFTKSCDSGSQKNCLGKGQASQHVQGLLLGVSYGLNINGVQLDAEAGQYLYVSDWSISVYCWNCGYAHSHAFGAPTTYSSRSELRRSSVISVSAGYKNVYVTYRRFFSIDGSGKGSGGVDDQYAIGLTAGSVNQLLVGFRF